MKKILASLIFVSVDVFGVGQPFDNSQRVQGSGNLVRVTNLDEKGCMGIYNNLYDVIKNNDVGVLESTMNVVGTAFLLHIACKNGNTEVVKLLLEHGANVNQQNENGQTPLRTACIYANSDVVQILLKHGADIASINFEHSENLALLCDACKNGNTEVVKLLLEHEADFNIKDSFNSTPLLIACTKGNAEIVKLILTLNGSE